MIYLFIIFVIAGLYWVYLEFRERKEKHVYIEIFKEDIDELIKQTGVKIENIKSIKIMVENSDFNGEGEGNEHE